VITIQAWPDWMGIRIDRFVKMPADHSMYPKLGYLSQGVSRIGHVGPVLVPCGSVLSGLRGVTRLISGVPCNQNA
jgi:hypothetical protein